MNHEVLPKILHHITVINLFISFYWILCRKNQYKVNFEYFAVNFTPRKI